MATSGIPACRRPPRLAGCAGTTGPKLGGTYDAVAYKPHNPGNVQVKVSLQNRAVYVMEGDRPLLVTSDFGQSLYIAHWHGMFGPRCVDELGYLPWRSLVPISQNDTCMRPVALSLHGDGRDPLDP